MNFFNELKRRNVFRMAGVYGVIGWLLIQVSATVKGPLHLPEWIDTLVILAVIGGFPIALLFSWAFEVTPEGLKRTADVPENASIAAQTAKRLDVITIGGLILVLAVIVVDRFLLPKQAKPSDVVVATESIEAAPVAATAPVADKSIAVLPFQNRSAKEEDAFFAEGMHDDLLTQLSKVSALRVISRTSMTQYAETTKTIPEIAKELGVAMILEGAVQRAGDHVRINVQLIDGATDKHLWAETYDREMTVANVFDIQSDITETIADALKVAVSGEEKAAIAALPTENVAAYDAYLLGKTLYAADSRNPDNLLRAVAALDEATGLDPAFVAAYAAKTRILLNLVWWNVEPEANLARAENALEKAKALAPDAFETKFAEAGYLYAGKTDYTAALDAYKALLPLAPNNTELWWEYAVTERRVGNFKAAIDGLEHGVALSPNDANNLATLGQTLDMTGGWRKAQAAFSRAKALAPNSSYLQILEFQSLWNIGDSAANWRFYESARAAGADAAYIDQSLGAFLAGFTITKDQMALLAERLAPYTDNEAILWGVTLSRAELLLRLGQEKEGRALAEETLARMRAMDIPDAAADDFAANAMIAASLLGRRAEARANVDTMLKLGADDALHLNAAGVDIARSLLRIGDTDRAFAVLAKLMDLYSPSQFGLARNDYLFIPFHDDPRYKALDARYLEWRKREGVD